MLPLAHMFGLVIEMLHPFVRGCHLYFLTRVPSPKVILDAFAQVKPKLIITVPLVIEKIIKKRVFPILEQPLMKILLKVPFVDERLLAKVQEKIYASFGGSLCELIVGGAALNREVGTLLHRIHFPITEGYGMTECAPLISYVSHKESRIGSCGKIVERMEEEPESRTTILPAYSGLTRSNQSLGASSATRPRASCHGSGPKSARRPS